LNEIDVNWLNSLFLIIKAGLLQLTFHKTYVSTHGGDARFQRALATAQHQDDELKKQLIKTYIQEYFATVVLIASDPDLLKNFHDTYDISEQYLEQQYNWIYNKIVSYRKRVK